MAPEHDDKDCPGPLRMWDWTTAHWKHVTQHWEHLQQAMTLRMEAAFRSPSRKREQGMYERWRDDHPVQPL